MNLSAMRQTLAAHGIQLTKSLGQNFLHDGNQIAKIMRAAQLRAGERVLEIGPGLGPLTEALLAAGTEVLAVEMDARLVKLLRQRFAGEPRLTLIHADAVRFLREPGHDWNEWKLVANLPYSVASLLLVDLALGATGPALAVITVQLEVAERLLATPGGRDYGLFTLLVQSRYVLGGSFRIPWTCFFPPPTVESACVSLARRSEPILEPDLVPHFASLVKLCFSQRRKMMLKLLKGTWPAARLAAAFDSAALPPESRAETVSLSQFVQLTRQLYGND